MFKLLKVKKLKNVLLIPIFIYVFISLFLYTNSIRDGIKQGYYFCLNLLIPSLFLFMVFSQLILNFKLNSKLESFFSKITFKLFKLPGICALPILTGLVGGYPVGATNIDTLLEKKLITEKQAEFLTYFLVGAGPAFIVNVVGVSLFGSKFLGILIFVSQLMASLILGIIISNFFMFKNSDSIAFSLQNLSSKEKFKFTKTLIYSVNKTSKNLFYMCSLVVFFSALINILKNFISIGLISKFINFLNINKVWLKVFVSILFEVTNGCSLCIENHLPIFFTIFAISWAGISVHAQIFYILKNLKFSKIKFMFFRIIHSILSTTIFYIFLLFVTDSKKVAIINKINKVCVSSFSCAPYSFSLLILCVCFLFTLTDALKKYFYDKKVKVLNYK